MKEKLETIKINFRMPKYKSIMKKFNISKEFMEVILSDDRYEDFKEVLKALKESNTFNELQNKLIEMCKIKHNYAPLTMLFGSLIKRFDYYNTEIPDISNYDNLKVIDLESTLKILKDNFVTYVKNNNKLKNKFLTNEHHIGDYTKELNEEELLQMFDNIVYKKGDYILGFKANIIKDYILKTISTYGENLIKNNMDFILYDINHQDNSTLEERKNNYYKKFDASDNIKYIIDNLDKLKEKIKTINNEEAKILLDRLVNVDINDYEEIEDIYMDYQILLREDIVDHLFIPTEHITVVEDFNDLRPQLIHLFLRNPYQFEENIKNETIEDILSKRAGINKSLPLTKEEEEEFKRRINNIDILMDPTQVNYSYVVRQKWYHDNSDMEKYHSDTVNQISASIFSEDYFLRTGAQANIIGIGFNKEGLDPSSIALASNSYITTNRGLNNLEYNLNYAMNFESSTFREMIDHDGKSEVVMFRRNMDVDTKASYVFATIDSSSSLAEDTIAKAREYASKYNMKLVIYDLYKIKKSYEMHLKNITNDLLSGIGKSR